MKRLFLSLCLVVLAAITVACSGAAADNPASAGPVDPNAPVITAQNMAFSPATLDVTANKAFSLTFDNKDGAPHNIDISDASGSHVFKGEIVAGKQVSYAVPALAAGTYTFICDVHPDMKGTITAQ